MATQTQTHSLTTLNFAVPKQLYIPPQKRRLGCELLSPTHKTAENTQPSAESDSTRGRNSAHAPSKYLDSSGPPAEHRASNAPIFTEGKRREISPDKAKKMKDPWRGTMNPTQQPLGPKVDTIVTDQNSGQVSNEIDTGETAENSGQDPVEHDTSETDENSGQDPAKIESDVKPKNNGPDRSKPDFCEDNVRAGRILYLPRKDQIAPESNVHNELGRDNAYEHPVLILSNPDEQGKATFAILSSCRGKTVTEKYKNKDVRRQHLLIRHGNESGHNGLPVLELEGGATLPRRTYVKTLETFNMGTRYFDEYIVKGDPWKGSLTPMSLDKVKAHVAEQQRVQNFLNRHNASKRTRNPAGRWGQDSVRQPSNRRCQVYNSVGEPHLGCPVITATSISSQGRMKQKVTSSWNTSNHQSDISDGRDRQASGLLQQRAVRTASSDCLKDPKSSNSQAPHDAADANRATSSSTLGIINQIRWMVATPKAIRLLQQRAVGTS
ncbi:hypothetical protein EJ06DRAFT_369743 [Trichodelitschia bisporula]|uniref:Uncharacterized protein n=1 Tax=Trichodelitschia bisporula TaxID=703511 RepID=A0A6G1I130_9PEZI|nr:hypothetical protein EJ06DRAFT_369743 [Trichodelitschia bisporula]